MNDILDCKSVTRGKKFGQLFPYLKVSTNRDLNNKRRTGWGNNRFHPSQK